MRTRSALRIALNLVLGSACLVLGIVHGLAFFVVIGVGMLFYDGVAYMAKPAVVASKIPELERWMKLHDDAVKAGKERPVAVAIADRTDNADVSVLTQQALVEEHIADEKLHAVSYYPDWPATEARGHTTPAPPSIHVGAREIYELPPTERHH